MKVNRTEPLPYAADYEESLNQAILAIVQLCIQAKGDLNDYAPVIEPMYTIRDYVHQQAVKEAELQAKAKAA